MEHLSSYLLTGVGAVLAYFLRLAILKLNHLGESVVKANLAFDEVSERKPEYARMFEAWKREGAIRPRAASARR